MDAASLGSGSYVFDPGPSIVQVLVVNSSTVELVLSTPLVVGALYTVTVTNVNDCPGNAITGSLTRPASRCPSRWSPAMWAINEVLYDPIGTGSDFVELQPREQDLEPRGLEAGQRERRRCG
ncbi:MAG: hypothetical protein IPF41_04360 [Flavobacteriales bacterium]|nr:hypothetical protein [Flavobacteriales bacterium]